MTDGTFLGTFTLGDTLAAAVPVVSGAGGPTDPPVAPLFRVYGEAGLMANGTGSLTKLDTAPVTGATDASPIALTAAGHGVQTGTKVNVAGVLGNTSANGEFTATRVDASTLSLDGSTGSGAYASGGTLHVAGLYQLSLPLNGGDGYEAGKCYQCLVEWAVSSVVYSRCCSFQVV